jgi:hypothetical protein
MHVANLQSAIEKRPIAFFTKQSSHQTKFRVAAASRVWACQSGVCSGLIPGLGGAFGAGIFAGIANITKSDQSREFPLLILPRW